MGAESSILDNCHLGKAFPLPHNYGYSVQPGETGDGQQIIVFLQKRKKQLDAVKKYAKNLKMIRHPCVIRFVASGATSGVPFLATEQVTPLNVAIVSLLKDELIAGINNIIQALAFIHDKLGAAHNNISTASVYVALNGSWKLGNFEHMLKFSATTTSSLEKCRECQEDAYIALEEKVSNYEVIPELVYSRDVFALGVMIEQLLRDLTSDDDTTDTCTLRTYAMSKLQHPNPSCRPRMNEILRHHLFRNDFLEIIEFLSTLVTKGPEEKQMFFNCLLPRLMVLPEQAVARRFARPLLSRFVLHDMTAMECVIPHLLTPRTEEMMPADGITPLLSESLFKEHVIPELIKIFIVRNLHIRLCLLQHLPRYVRLFDHNDLIEHIFPEILLGLRDTSDELVVASLQTLAHLVPLIGAGIVIGGTRFQFFKQGKPKFLNRPGTVSGCQGSVISDSSDQSPNGVASVEEERRKILARTRQEVMRKQRRDSSRRNSEVTREHSHGDDVFTPHRDSNNALWDIIQRGSHDNENHDTESDRSSLSTNDAASPTKLCDDVKVDWSDVRETKNPVRKVTNSLKLSNPNRSRHQLSLTLEDRENIKTLNGNERSSEVHWSQNDNDWDDRDHWSPFNSPIKSDSPQKSQLSKTANGGASYDSKTTGHTDDNKSCTLNKSAPRTLKLGEEFDIKSIVVAPSTDDLDFFADMAPGLKSTTQPANKTIVSPVASKTSLSYQVNDNEVECGWGSEELEWGNEF